MENRITAWFVQHEEWHTYPDGRSIGWDERDFCGLKSDALVFLTNILGATAADIRRICNEVETENFAEFGKYWISAHKVEESYIKG